MPLYHFSKKETYIKEISHFLLTNFINHLDLAKVILPNGYLCNHLQKTIIHQSGTTILPKVIPINDISTEKEEVFKIPSQQIGRITALEEKMILAEIIHSYDSLNYSLPQSLAFASPLARLFFEFEINDIDFALLKELPIADQAEHWHTIYSFLEFSYYHWQQKISSIQKLSSAEHQKLMFSLELDRIKNSDNHIIVAGVIGNNQVIKNFLAEICKLDNGHIILPPFPSEFLENWQAIEVLQPEDPLYNINKLLLAIGSHVPCHTRGPLCHPHAGGDPENIISGWPRATSGARHDASERHENKTILDNLLTKTTNSFYDDNIEYSEFSNISTEAEYVALRCNDLLLSNPDTSIAILITDPSTKDYFISKLIKYNLKFSDQIGQNCLTSQTTTFILEVAKNICQSFSLKNFLNLILHPLVISDETRNLKKLIVKNNRFAENIEDVIKIIKDNCSNETSEKIIEICNLINKEVKEHNFNTIFKNVLIFSEKIWNKLQGSNYNHDVIKTLTEVIKTNWAIKINNIENFPDILKELISGGVTQNPNINTTIKICSANDSTLINYDLLIYTNFIENTYPIAQTNNPWLTKQMISNLGIDSWTARFGNSMYDFYLNLHNTKVLITRSIKTINGEISLPSPFLFKLKTVLDNNFKQFLVKFVNPTPSTILKPEYVYSKNFPKQISATDIETLIRAPYNFYAKKILHLKPEKEVEDTPKFSEFGSFFHKVVEIYTKNYEASRTSLNNQYQTIVNYSKQLLDDSIFPSQTKRIWQIKLEAIAKEFIEFDNIRRSKIKKVFSELRGELELNIAGKMIKLVAVADRIELTSQNKAIIMDYKTGIVPTKKDVLSGLSPQLIIEAIILLEGGFVNLPTSVETESLIYVKLGSSTPFLSTTEINITKQDILDHKEGLINLLTHYITNGKYNIEQNLVNYDDYWHFARRG